MIPIRTLIAPAVALTAAVAWWASSSPAAGPNPAPAPVPAGADGYQARVAGFFAGHCVKCHRPEKTKGDIDLTVIDGDLAAGRELEHWELILDVLKAGEMPPEGEAQPAAADRAAVVAWIEAGLRDYVARASQAPTVPTTRRLTNFEYQNTMRDLLGFELNLAANLPEDPVKPYHFNNSAEFMLIGPEQMDRYAENARRAMASAIVDPAPPKVHRTEKTWEPTAPADQGVQPDELGIRGGPRYGVKAGLGLKSWPETGEFRIRIKAAAILPPGYGEVPLQLVIGTNLRHDGGFGVFHPVGTVHLKNRVDDLQEFEFRGRIENAPYEPARPAQTKGGRDQAAVMKITFQNLFDNGELNDHPKSQADSAWELSVPRAVVRSVVFEAPVADVWPPEHHTRILFDSPLRTSDPDAYARQVIERFATRAFRRPVTPAELDRFAKMYRLFAAEFDTLEQAMRETLAMVLISPQFLYHTVAENGVADRPYELASKLSYFLWGTMPDDELFTLAGRNELDDPDVIAAQVKRMLADGRSRDFVRNFTTQWLGTDKARTVAINLDLFPRFLYTIAVGERHGQEVSFRPTIRDYMADETVGFVAELIRRNASVLDVVDSDFAVLNEPLAAHYGVEGVRGLELRPVPVRPEHHLGGLLTHGSVLVGNSTGSAPHPIYRAVWLREAILGDTVKPPPAEVPALSDTAGESADTAVTIKDLLAKHRTQASCADCHVRLDPWGIPFERYNACGKFQPKVPKEKVRVRGFSPDQDKTMAGYRAYLDTVNTVDVQADARVPHGPEIDGMGQLKTYLLAERADAIAANVTRRLMTYGLGRELTYRDRFAVEKILTRTEAGGHKFADVLTAICQSETFRSVPPKGD